MHIQTSTTTHTLTPRTLFIMWLFLGGLSPYQLCSFECMCACLCVCACTLNQYCVKPSPTLFEYRSRVFPLPHLNPVPLRRGGRFWLGGGGRAGSAASQASWLVRCSRWKPAVLVLEVSVNGFGAVVHTGMWGFRIIRLKKKGRGGGGTWTSRCHIKNPVFLIFVPSHPSSSRPSAAP